MENRKHDVVIIGNGSLIIPCGEYLLDNGFKILGIVTSDFEVELWSENNRILIIPETEIMEVGKMEFDYLFSIVYLDILPREIITKPKKAAINYHDALLPTYAGIHATSWAIMNGEKKHGITWHIMEEKLDAGNILVQKEIDIDDDETAVSLNIKCYQAAVKGFCELIDAIISGDLVEHSQNEFERTYYGKWKKPKQASLINWNETSEAIIRFVNSLDFGEYDNTLATPKIAYKGNIYIVKEIRTSERKDLQHHPSYAIRQENALFVNTKDGVLEIKELCDLEGKEVAINEVFSEENTIFSLEINQEKYINVQERIAALAKKESYWVQKYEKYCMDYSIWNELLHYDNTMINVNNICSDFHKLSLNEKLVLAIAAELYACGITTTQYIGYCDTSFKGYPFFEEVVPCCLKFDAPEYLALNVKSELQEIQEHGSYLKDIFARYKSINNSHIVPYITVYVSNTSVDNTASKINYFINEELGTVDYKCSNEDTRKFAERILKRMKNLEGEITNTKNTYEMNEFKTVYQLIREQINKQKDKVAIIAGETQITYHELGDRIDERAALFYHKGIRKGMNVGVLLPRNHEVLISFVALQKLGAIYIPMDSTYPLERLDFMAEDAQISFFVTETKMSIQWMETAFETVYIDESIKTEELVPEPEKLKEKDPVYILYTSGSTGKPKGVVINHLGLSNFLLSMQKEPGFTEDDILLSVTTVCFDISGLELYLPLICGGVTNIVPSEITNDGIMLREMIESSNVTVIQATPATWNMLILAGWEKKLPIKILCGGESLAIELADKLLKQCNELWNMYGPTETTIWSTIKHITDKNCINIGKPIDNTQVWVLDKNMQEVQGSQSGELYIGGYGVANGYYRREQLTTEKFIENPLKKGDKIYRTGDLAEINEEGEVIYLGRIDNQVKYHGFRIELEEIERVMQEKLNLEKAIVVIRKDDLNQDALYAFIQSDNERNREEDEKKLREFLPHYMIPCEFIRLRDYPLTANKKINRKFLISLPVPAIIEKYANIIEPKEVLQPKERCMDCENDNQELEGTTLNKEGYIDVIKKVAAEVLKKDVSSISGDMNLGHQGFNSVRYTVFSMRINKLLGVNVTPAICYKYKTINELAKYLASNSKGKEGTITINEGINTHESNIIDTKALDIKEKIRSIVAEVIKSPADAISINTPLSMYGFNSVRYTVLCTKINEELHVKITPAICYRYKTIAEIYNYLSNNVDMDSDETKTGDRIAEVSSDMIQLSMDSNQIVKEKQHNGVDDNDIAIIGIGLKMPQADNAEEYWNIIKEGKCVVDSIPRDRWDCLEYKQYDKEYPDYGAFMNDIWSFDASFFHISPREAAQMDPQQRLFLETSWKTIEDAGYNPESLAGADIAVYVGTVESDYYNRLSRNIDQADIFTISGNIQCGIANRVSYLLDFHGESETINTACSSSLVAINHAVNALQRGECSMAIAGGVNVLLNPFMHYALKQNGMLSPDGRCMAFDSRANGYVRGEGCGVLLLKPYRKACDDGNHIYAIIKGSAVNHDGMTNSFTAPNPLMQTALIKNLYERCGIQADQITFIETHGTGTKLGDPIEVNALKDAFDSMYQDQNIQRKEQYCALGSVKANIGHLEAAAGIASVLKVILQMKYKMIPKIAGMKEVNPYIETQNSPFYIPQENQKWEGIIDETGKRKWIAGVSSFGFGGTNAHIIMEAFDEPKGKKKSISGDQFLFPISNETEEGLHRYVKKMADYIQEERITNGEDTFADIAGVLQGGRRNCRCRVAFIAQSKSQLLEKMSAYLQGELKKGVYAGMNDESKILDLLLEGKEGNEYLRFLYDNKIEKIAQLWVSGADIKWEEINNQEYQKLSLPTYEFSRDEYRLDSIYNYSDMSYTKRIKALDISKKKEFIISPDIPYIKEHVIDGTSLFPGAMFIGMGIQSSMDESLYPLVLEENEWIKAKPVYEEELLTVEIESDGEWCHYEILSECNGKKVLHARGKSKKNIEPTRIPRININNILESCKNALTRNQIYDAFRNFGFSYGAIYQPVESINYNKNEYLSKIRVSLDSWEEYDDNIRLIRLLEGGMQSVIASLVDQKEAMRFIPVGIKKCNVYCIPKDKDLYGYARLVHTSETEHVITKEFDIDITDCTGEIVTQLLGYTLRVQKLNTKDREEFDSLTIYKNKYVEADSPSLEHDHYEKKLLIISNESMFLNIVNDISNKYQSEIVTDIIGDDGESIEEKVCNTDAVIIFANNDVDSYSLLLEISKACIQSKRKKNILYVYRRGRGDNCCINEAVRGFANCFRNESAKSFFKVLELDDDNTYIREIEQELFACDYQYVIYQHGKRVIENYDKIGNNHGEELVQDPNGCYMITGGTGRIGIALAERLRKMYPEAKLVLIGKNKTNKMMADSLNSYDEDKVSVIQADISDGAQVREVVNDIHRRFGSVKGVFHAAGIVNDAYIVNKQYMDAIQVINTKIQGIQNLDLYLKEEDLDFVVLFSSISTILGNAGQSDYCYANAYLNAFATYRNSLVDEGLRKGKTISINWGLWENGGMQLRKADLELLRCKNGIIPLSTEQGLQFLLCSGDLRGVFYAAKMENDNMFRPQKQMDTLETAKKISIAENDSSDKEVEDVDIHNQLNDVLRRCLSKVIRLDVEKILLNKELSEYGLDSLTNTELANEINEILGIDITPITFFEYTNLAALSKYLQENYAQEISRVSGCSKRTLGCEAKAREKIDMSTFRINANLPYAQGHTVFGKPVILGVTYISHFAESLQNQVLFNGEFQNIMFHEAVTVEQNDLISYKVLQKHKNEGISFTETCENDTHLCTVATATFHKELSNHLLEHEPCEKLQRNGREVDGEYVYKHKWCYDVGYKKEMQSLEKIWIDSDIALGRISIHPALKGLYKLNPAVLDGAMICGLYAFLENVKESYIPYMIKKVIIRKNLSDNCYCICKKNSLTDEILSMDISILAEDGNIACYIKDFICKKIVNAERFVSTNSSKTNTTCRDIAIIGMSASFAGAKSVEQYWKALAEKRDCIKEIPIDHFDYRDYYDSESHGDDKMYTKWGGFIEDVDKFDASFFNISRREAEVMDPQIRLLLQHTYHAAEDAGYAGTLKGSNTGMYVGCCFHDYQQKMDRNRLAVTPHDLTGNAMTMLANRTSYCLDLNGPSVNIDTACSSSLVALHMACQGLLDNECDMAFVGGANLLLDSWHYRYFCSIGALSKTGRCHTFSDEADGYIPGEGIAVLLLKPLEKAVNDNDNIYGVIKGSAINHGGMTTSVTAPDMMQEAKVIKAAWKSAGISGEDISYIEAHGTGTRLGDPIEVNALKKAFQETHGKNQTCYVGSAKASIGHTEGAAGLAGVIKVLLSMRNEELPAMPLLNKLNPYINLEGSNLCIHNELIKWQPVNGSRIAGVSSFGAGGAYAHVVLEEYKYPKIKSVEKAERLIILSAKKEESLKQYIKDLLEYLKSPLSKGQRENETWLRDISYSLMIGREQLNVRLAFCVDGIPGLIEKLKGVLNDSMEGYLFKKSTEDDLLTREEIRNENDLNQIARLWIEGNKISGEQISALYDGAYRISLPGYAFDEKSYWVELIPKRQEDVVCKDDFFMSKTQ